MIQEKQYAIISGSLFILGIFLCAVYNNWIIFSYPSYKRNTKNLLAQNHVQKKPVALHYWHREKWHSEQTPLIWSNNTTQNVSYLINTWLTLLDEEDIMDKKVSLQAVLLDSSKQEAFLSFDRNPLAENSSTFEKWQWIESLLKTMRTNGVSLQRVRFLVHHQEMIDDHLDFSNPWPLSGFSNQ